MEGPERIVLATLRWCRARTALRGALIGGLGGVLWLRAASLFGLDPLWALSLAGMGLLVGLLWPTRSPWVLLAAGRRLGVGERLAALDALLRTDRDGLVALVYAEVRRCRPGVWRLMAGPWELVGAMTLALAVILLPLVVGPAQQPAHDHSQAPTHMPDLSEVQAVGENSETEREPSPSRWPGALLGDFSPYEDLLAAVLGLSYSTAGGSDTVAEDVARRLAEQEGLLRELSERLAQLASGETQEGAGRAIAQLAEQVAREDLRELLRTAEDGAQEHVRRAYEATEAILARSEELTQRRDAHREDQAHNNDRFSSAAPERGAGSRGLREESALTEAPSGVPMGSSIEELPFWDSAPEGDRPPVAPHYGSDHRSMPSAQDEDSGGLPGTARGEEPVIAQTSRPPTDEPPISAPTPVRPGDGPTRDYVIAEVPSEGEDHMYGARLPSPQEVEILLSGRILPPGLLDVVRRYFDIVTTNEGGAH